MSPLIPKPDTCKNWQSRQTVTASPPNPSPCFSPQSSTTAPCAFAYRSARIRRLVRLGIAP